ncbi:uncharacterized protein LOC110038569 [Phalaenopsis equestris]|uniref:uncharacterized protein LOC110038569 n=1 Tax=Phalaenopsis equestris TaxID=78828 RepID=UPI0009E639A4|nr:uncharacterized protein LOC110038569 [Phalaenopsis equestris]
MADKCQSSKNGESSLKYWWIPLEVQTLEPDYIVLRKNFCSPSTSSPKCGLLSDRRSSKGLTISHFRSVAAGIWDFVGHPAIFPSKDFLKYDNLYEKDIIFRLDTENDVPAVYSGAKIFQKNADIRPQYSNTSMNNFENLKRIKKMLFLASCNRNFNSFNFQSTAFLTGETNRADGEPNIDSSSSMAETATNMTPKHYFAIKDIGKFIKSQCHEIDESCTIGKVCSDSPDIQGTENFGKSQETDFVIRNSDSNKYGQKPTSSLSSDHTLQPSTSTKEAITILRQSSSGLQPTSDMEKKHLLGIIKRLVKRISSLALSLIEDFSPKSWLVIQNKLQRAFSNNRHAVAGALAGTLVTLCLHPVDTIKTVIQANEMGQKSFYGILRRIISQHGIFGLYRGIASNITSSAPISAIYTFTYESVKCNLLPLLPKEYHSIAHCIAGGCSSIATSFVYTPSERIKQQMQVSSQYQNCWKALLGCLRKGGIPSLYVGWGAVLCRNIPHSIIKFYTYESLKQFFSTAYPDSNLQALQTLLCGGLAGSTAALFTTPFDVVKTRLQIQRHCSPSSTILNSVSLVEPKHSGKTEKLGLGTRAPTMWALLLKFEFKVALQEIARQEGLQGLYRGLTPRLAMYVSQGAIFFASYEFLKAVFLLESPEDATKMKENEICLDDQAAAGLQKLPA